MKLQQLRFLAAVAQNDLNLTVTAAALSTTQPAISKQLKLLEAELGFDIFVRKGRSLIRLTKTGEAVVARALRILREVQGIKAISDDVKNAGTGSLSIGTTHTQARYVLPKVIRVFRSHHPGINLHLHQGTSEQIAAMVALGRVDLAIDSGSHASFESYNLLPCHRWHLCVVVPELHPLTQVGSITLGDLAGYPLVTCESGSDLKLEGLQPNVILTVSDSDVVKTYVRLGMGVGLIPEDSREPKADAGLAYIDARHLFPINSTWVGFARGTVIRGFVYDFLSLLAPHLTRPLIDQAAACTTQRDVDALFGPGHHISNA